MIDLSIRRRFRDFDLDVAFRSESRTLALFGESGAGKTSVLNAIAGLLRKVEGRIVLDDRVLLDSAAGVAVSASRRAIGYVFQEGHLFPHLRVRANLLYGARGQENGAGTGFDAVVELLDLGALLARAPLSLSGGERQRVAIGRALLSGPRTLLLDEPLTGLHREARADVLEHLRRLKHELAIGTILVSHQPDEVAALADEVVLLQGGRIAGQVPIARFGALRGAELCAAPPSG
jgi:molybdate transport system ATP-binding protein